MAIRLKSEYAGVVIGFKNKSLPLGERSESDLIFLYERALERNNKRWLEMFDVESQKVDEVKSEEFLKKWNEKSKIKKPGVKG